MIAARLLLGALAVFSFGALAACGDSDDSNGNGGTSGSGGGQSDCCPAERPADGNDCSGCEGAACTYLECSGLGEAQLTCSSGAWQLTATPCAAFDCGGSQCAAGQICVAQAGGALIHTCADNPCVGEPLTCGCAAAVCPGTCQGFSGLTLSCNTCRSGQCP